MTSKPATKPAPTPQATNPSGANGALFDTDSSNSLGGLCTLIGFGINSVFGSPTNQGFEQAELPTISRIGTGSSLAQAAGFTGKAVKFNIAVAPVAIGGAFTDTYVNRTGAAVPIGAGVFSVAP